jgi:hypothetical protein
MLILFHYSISLSHFAYSHLRMQFKTREINMAAARVSLYRLGHHKIEDDEKGN